MYFWDVVLKHAEKQRSQLWDALRLEGHIPNKETLMPGTHVLTESPHLVASARVSLPVHRFSADTLAELLKLSKYKVPEPVTKEYCEQAKIPTKSQIAMMITER